MSKTLDVTSERVDDIPLLLAQLERMGVQELLDKHFVTHGNWKSLSLGWCSVVWLSYILSQADHRLSYVQDWVDKRQKTLALCTKQSLKALDFTDDRLEGVLRYLSDDESWQQFETELGGTLIRVYDLQKDNIRLDSTTASGYCGITEDGLFQWGHFFRLSTRPGSSKDNAGYDRSSRNAPGHRSSTRKFCRRPIVCSSYRAS